MEIKVGKKAVLFASYGAAQIYKTRKLPVEIIKIPHENSVRVGVRILLDGAERYVSRESLEEPSLWPEVFKKNGK